MPEETNDTLKKREQILREKLRVLDELDRLYAEAGTSGPAASLHSDDADQQVDNPLVDLPLSDAIIAFLKERKEPSTAIEIWDALEKAGRHSRARDPVSSVTWAIRKAMSESQDSDLFSFGWGKWDVKSNYTEAELRRVMKITDGRGGRSRDEHVARTRAGIAKAKAEGKRIGAKRRITADQIGTLKRLLDEGDRTIKAACEAAGMSYAYYNLYRDEILAWEEGDPWPPSKNEDKDTDEPRFSVVS